MGPPDLFAKDYHNLHDLLVKYWPEAGRPLLIGNDCNTNPSYLTKWLPLVQDVLNVTTYHHYDGYGGDKNLAEEIMTPKFLDKTVSSSLDDVHAKYAPKSLLWVGEAAAAWHSGRAGVTNAFASSFWWSDALGALAARNHTGYCRQTLIGGNYGLLNRTNYEPNPDWYVGKLFHDLMGDIVLSPSGASASGKGYLRTYAHCNRQGAGVTLLLINIAPKTTFRVFGGSSFSTAPRDEYELTAADAASPLASRYIQLNGETLRVSNGRLPTMTPRTVSGDVLEVRPQSIGFYVFPKFKASICESSDLPHVLVV